MQQHVASAQCQNLSLTPSYRPLLLTLSPMAETQWLLTDKSPSAGSISMSDGADRSTDCMAPPTEHHEKAHIHCPGYSNSFAAAAHLHVQRTGQQRRHAAPGSLDGRLQPSAAAALSAAPPTAPPLLPAGEEGQMKRGSLLGNMQSASHLRPPGLQALIQRIKAPTTAGMLTVVTTFWAILTCRPSGLGCGLVQHLHALHLCHGQLVPVPGSGRNHELAHQVLEAVAAEQHDKKLGAVHEVHVQALRPVLVVTLPQFCIAQHLQRGCSMNDEHMCFACCASRRNGLLDFGAACNAMQC